MPDLPHNLLSAVVYIAVAVVCTAVASLFGEL